VILRSMPGLGRIILAVLLGEVWQPLRRRDYHALRSLSGVAPVTRRSGKTCVVVRRYACNKRLANALYHWATASRPLGMAYIEPLPCRRSVRDGLTDRLLKTFNPDTTECSVYRPDWCRHCELPDCVDYP
jgi:transposase